MYASRRLLLHILQPRSTARTGPVGFRVGVNFTPDVWRKSVWCPWPEISYSWQLQGLRVCTGARAVAGGPATPCETQALSQREFEQAFDFCKTVQGEEAMVQQLRKHGMKPATQSEQGKRYLGNYLARIPPGLTQSSTICSWLVHQEPELLKDILDDNCMMYSQSNKSDRKTFQTFSKVFSVYHIIPKSRGGKNHPCNYFVMPSIVNKYFGSDWTAEKVAYIGKAAAVEAGRLHGF